MLDRNLAKPVNRVAAATPATPQNESFAQTFGVDQLRPFMTFDPKTPEGRKLLDKCDEAADWKLSDMNGMRFKLIGFYGSFVPLPGPTPGEVRNVLRTCLITDDGEVLACMSNGVRASIVRLCEQWGLPPWRSPIAVQVVFKPTKYDNDRIVILNDDTPPEEE